MPERAEVERDEPERDEPDRDEPEREEPDRDRPPDELDRERLLVERLLELDPPVDRDELDRDRPPDELERERLRARRRVVVARSARGTSARTTSLTRRPSSASRNFAIRSSSRLIALASCAVSRSPTASAKVWMRE